ncbi:MAG: glycosyltransferase [Candidatus Omnitrophota bacterium]
MRKVKVLRIIARLNIGGPAIHVILLTEGLGSLRLNSLLVCGVISKDEGDMCYYAREKGVIPIVIPQLKRELNLFNDFIAFLKILCLIITVKPDIIHTHTAKAGALGRLAGIICNFKLKKTRLVHTFHGHIFDGYFSPFRTKVFIFIERVLAIFTSKIITVSESVKSELVSLNVDKPSKITVIPLGFELSKFLTVAPRINTVLSIGIVGRLVPIKNHILFLDSASRIIKQNPALKIEFKIIGDGEIRSVLEKHTKNLGIEKYVHFLGWQKDLAMVYSDLDIVALTSLNEGTPVSLIEAMAAARPIVATNVGGVSNILGNARKDYSSGVYAFKVLERGLLVNPGDTAGFAAAMEFLLENRNIANDMGVKGREYASRQFNKERLVKDIETLYQGLMA